uniref:CSON006825 protein n=1 Tax=Culicoides sonorensis TaxID=179676 RepID=A0A336M8S6_CULSO
MYKIKPINQIWPNIELPECMYNMKTVVNLKLEESAEYPNINISMNEIDSLAGRQEKLLIQLEQFKKQLQDIRSGLNICSKPAQPSTSDSQASRSALPQIHDTVKKPIDTQHLNQLVVNANPKYIPYCLLALKKLWHDRLTLIIKFHTHSSVKQLGEDVKNFMNKVMSLESRMDIPTLQITLIWHSDVSLNTELIATPASYAPLQGEVTLLRYLTRVGPNEFNYEANVNTATEVDSILDLCYLLLNTTETKERLKHIRLLNTYLGKQQLYGGKSVSLADVAVSSTVQQGNLNDLTPALKSWLQRVSPLLGY